MTMASQRLLEKIEALKQKALTEHADQADELARQISALEFAQAQLETLSGSGPWDFVEPSPGSGSLEYAALRARLYAKSPEETQIADELGLFRVE